MKLEIETRRLLLRPLRRSDLVSLVRLLDDIEVSRYTARIPHPYRMQDAEEFLALVQKNEPGKIRLSVTQKDAPDTVIGGISCEADDTGKRAALGYWLGKAHWGQGYGSEAAAAMLDHAFRSLPVEMIFADCHPQNIASMRILQSLGFGPAGLRTSFSLALRKKTEVMRFELPRKKLRKPLFTVASASQHGIEGKLQ